MKLKKIFAALAATAVAATMSISALAVDIETTIDSDAVTPGANFMADFDAANVDAKESAKVTITFTIADETAGFGGGFVLSTKANNWVAVEFGNADSGKEIIAEATANAGEYTITREVAADFFDAHVAGAEGEYAQIALQQWWGNAPIVVTEVAVEMKDGSVYKFSEGPVADEAPEETPDPEEDEDGDTAPEEEEDDNAGNTGLVGLSVAGLAVAGAAVVATKKRK